MDGDRLQTCVSRLDDRNLRPNPYKDELIVLSVEVVEVIAPQVLGVSCINEPVAVGRTLDEHVRWQVIQIPICRYFNQPGILTLDQWFHPFFSFLGIVNLRPGVISPQVISLAIMMAHAVVVFDTI